MQNTWAAWSAVFACVSNLLAAPAANAWNADEHASIGGKGYLAACACMEIKLRGSTEHAKHLDGYECTDEGPKVSTTDAMLERLGWLCPPGPRARSRRAASVGQLIAISGDHAAEPEDFENRRGGRRIASILNYGALAIGNHAHFQPTATPEWRGYRNAALDLAVEASAAEGSEQVALIEKALFLQAFADHFLEDAFAAGHMGINRPASGPAGAVALHDWWNENGRIVSDGFEPDRVVDGKLVQGQQQTWRTYGDGSLARCRADDAACGKRLHAGQTRALRDFIWASAMGKRHHGWELDTERSLPTHAFSPGKLSTFYGTYFRFQSEVAHIDGSEARGWLNEEMAFTRTGHISRPAYRSSESLAGYVYTPLVDAPHSIYVDHAALLLPISVWWRISLGASLDIDAGDGPQGATVRLRPLLWHTTALSLAEGMLNHEVSFAELDLVLRPDREDNTTDFVTKLAGYRLNFELGRIVLHGDVGLALGYVAEDGDPSENGWKASWFAGGGLSYVYSSSGGGNWHGQGE